MILILWIASSILWMASQFNCRDLYCELSYSDSILCKGLSLYDVPLTEMLSFSFKEKNVTIEKIANTTKLHITKSDMPQLPFQIYNSIPKVVNIAITMVRIPVLSNNFFQKHEIYSYILLLELSQNDMHTIHDDVFEDMINLESLSINNNYLTVITSKLLQNVPRLRSLGLDDNIIEAIEPTAFKSLISLKRAHFDDNRCVNENMYYWSDKHISTITTALKLCFHNWEILKANPDALTVDSAKQSIEMQKIETQLQAIIEKTRKIQNDNYVIWIYFVCILLVVAFIITVFKMRYRIMNFVMGQETNARIVLHQYENDAIITS